MKARTHSRYLRCVSHNHIEWLVAISAYACVYAYAIKRYEQKASPIQGERLRSKEIIVPNSVCVLMESMLLMVTVNMGEVNALEGISSTKSL